MPDVNLQHLMAVALIDGTVSFEMSHSRERMKDPRVLAVKARVQLVGDRALVDPAAPRSGVVEATLARRPRGPPLHAAPAGHEGESAQRRGRWPPRRAT